MAQRPIFVSRNQGTALVLEMPIDFTWHPGLSISQKRKSIRSLHEAAKERIQNGNILEISSKSETELGRSLSAFSLTLALRSGTPCTVECAFQGSKVLKNGGPYTDLYGLDSRSAKSDDRIRHGGPLVEFCFEDEPWPKNPTTSFYDWIYINALHQHPELSEAVVRYDAFTDIEFNPKKSVNCQARSASRYVALRCRGQLEEALADRSLFLSLYASAHSRKEQRDLFEG